MFRAALGIVGSQIISSTSARVPPAGMKFIAVQALTDLKLSSSGNMSSTGVVGGFTSEPMVIGMTIGGLHTSIALSSSGYKAIGYYGI